MRLLSCLSVAAVIVACAGCAGRAGAGISPEISPDFRARAANEPILIYPLELVKVDRVYHDPHEAARFGEALRRNGFTTLRLSAQHVDLKATPTMGSAQMLRAAKDAIARQVRQNPPHSRFGMFAGYALDKNETPLALFVVAATAAGEPALAVIVDEADPRFAEHPPRNMLECAELLGHVAAQELGLCGPK